MRQIVPINKKAPGVQPGGLGFSQVKFTIVNEPTSGQALARIISPFGAGSTFTDVSGDAAIAFDTATGTFSRSSTGTWDDQTTVKRKVRVTSANGERELAETFRFAKNLADAPPVVVPPVLNDLTVSSGNLTAGTTVLLYITGRTAGSTLTATNLPGGLTLNSSAGTIGGTVSSMTGTFAGTITESLSGVTKTSNISLNVVAVASFAVNALTVTSQPEDGLVWEQVVAADGRPISLSKGSGGDTSLFMVSGNAYTLSRTAYQANRTYTGNLIATDANNNTVTVPVSRSVTQGVAATLVSESYTPSLVGTANTQIEALADGRWHRTAKDTGNYPSSVYLDGNGGMMLKGGGGDELVDHSFTANSATNPKISLTLRTQKQYQNLRLIAFSDRQGNRIVLDLLNFPGDGSVNDPNSSRMGPLAIKATLATGWNTKAGIATLISGAGKGEGASDQGRLPFFADKPDTITFAFDTDNKRLTVSTSTSTDPLVFDMTNLPLPTGGKDFGFGAYSGYAQGDGIRITSYQYSTASGSLAVVSAPARSGNNVLTQTMSATGFTPQNLDFRLRSTNGTTVLQDWLPAKFSVAGGQITVTGTSPGVQNSYLMDVRNRRDTAVVGLGTSPILTYSVVNVRFGVNPGDVNYYSGVPIRMNWGEYMEPRINGYEYSTWDRGAVRAYFPRAGIPAGVYKFKTNTGVTVGLDTAGKDINCAMVSSDPTTGTHVINIKGDMAQSPRGFGSPDIRGLTFSGTLCNWLQVVEKDGVAIAREDINPQFVAFHSQFIAIRTLDMGRANNADQNKDPSRYADYNVFKNFDETRADNFGVIVDAANAVKKANPKFEALWWVVPNDIPMDQLLKGFAYAKANLASGIRLMVEVNNEVWNLGTFFRTLTGLMLDAIMAGWYSSTSTYASRDSDVPAVRPYAIIDSYTTDGNSGLKVAVPAGKLIFHPCPAGALFTALKDNPAGTPFTDTTAWDRSPTDKYMPIGGNPLVQRGQILRHKEVTDALVSVYGDANVPSLASMVLMTQQKPDYNAVAKPLLDVPGVRVRTKYIGSAPYAKPTGPSDRVWTAETMVDALYDQLTETRSSIRNTEQYALANGMETAYYEMNRHPGAGESANYDQVLNDLAYSTETFSSGRSASGWYKDYTITFRQEASGLVMWYNGIYNTVFGLRPTIDFPIHMAEDGIAAGIAAQI